ncbi:MAG TPA: phage tail protein [Verrucomicrobiota bacterium]|nr:hypothetical protein [Verrucomicrobiales bacterium]HRI15305.1 phage tail protein [Verrucomicrobiota bacterium]
MALTAAEQRAQYPLMAYNYRVNVSGATMSFSEVSGLVIEYETVTYQHGLSFLEGEAITKFRYDKYAPVTLKRGVVRGYTALRDWLQSLEARALDISLCDEQGIPVITWHVGKALAVKLEAPPFNASSDDVAIESLELKVSRITLEHH